MPNIGPMEIVLLLGLALLLFGAKRLPEIGRSMGKGMREFKDSVSGDHHLESDIHHRLDQVTVVDNDAADAHTAVREVTVRETPVTVRKAASVVREDPVVIRESDAA